MNAKSIRPAGLHSLIRRNRAQQVRTAKFLIGLIQGRAADDPPDISGNEAFADQEEFGKWRIQDRA